MGEKRIKMSELSRMSGLTYETIFKLYHNKTKGVDFVTLNKICSALECDISDIFNFIQD